MLETKQDVRQEKKPQEKPPATRAALANGNHAFFDQLYSELAPRVLGYLLRRMPYHADAEDVLQETFLAAYSGRNSYRGASSPLAWLLGIARRRCAERLRHPENCRLTERDERDTQDISERIANALTLEEAILALPPTLQEALELVVIQQLTYKEAATLLGTPQGTLKWRVHEATRLLRTQLERNDHD